MSRKDKINENFRKAVKEKQLRDDYNDYLKKKGVNASSAEANLYAIEKTRAGAVKYMEYTEREIILMLAGELPFMYD